MTTETKTDGRRTVFTARQERLADSLAANYTERERHLADAERVTKRIDKDMIAMYKSGLGADAIGKIAGLTGNAVRKRLKASGVEMRSGRG